MVICSECGEQNQPGTEFCVYCHAFLAWDDAEPGAQPQRRSSGGGAYRSERGSAPGRPKPAPRPRSDSEQNFETRMMPKITEDSPPFQPVGPPPTPAPQSAEDAVEGRFRLASDHPEVTVPATGEPAGLTVRVTNTSSIVDGYTVVAPGAPSWLILEATQVSLLPGAEDELPVRMRVVADTLVPAQQIRLVLRINSLSQEPAHRDLPVLVTVPVVDVPVRLRAEPRLIRVRDQDTAGCTVVVDNSSSNRVARLQFSGSDPELAVQFRFEPPILEVGPGATGSVRVTARASGPEPGQEVSRALTLTALDGTRSVETLVTLQQSTSVRVEDPMVTLEVVPALIRVRDTTVGEVRLVADNRRGTEWAHLRLQASDPERAVAVTWSSAQLHVPPGRTAQAQARFEAPLPERGTEASRTVTVAATDGRRTTTANVTFVQVASASPMTTLSVRAEPSIVRVQDADGANLQVVVDNRRGPSGVRVFLQGSDPEGAMRFTFSPPVVDLPAGQYQPVALRIDAWRPPPGQESNRPFTITAGDGQSSVEASGSLVQASSRAPIELLSVQLDPSVLHLGTQRRAQLRAVLDNRRGVAPVRVSMRGDDPQNIVRFSFAPTVLDVPPGSVTTAMVTVEAPRAPDGRELTRPFKVVATDGRSETQPAEGSIVQATPERKPRGRSVARVLFTLFGGLLMIFGALRPFVADDETGGGFDVNDVAERFGGQARIGDTNLHNLITVGAVVVALAVLVMFGLTGPKGRLTRLAAFLAAVLVVGLLVALALFGSGSSAVLIGPVLILIGCVLGYIGGLLARR